MNKDGLAPPSAARAWTRIDDYLGAGHHTRVAARRGSTFKPAFESYRPHFTLSTLPFLALLVGLAIATVGIAVAAWRERDTPTTAPRMAPELGTAQRGWYQEAQRDFRG